VIKKIPNLYEFDLVDPKKDQFEVCLIKFASHLVKDIDRYYEVVNYSLTNSLANGLRQLLEIFR